MGKILEGLMDALTYAQCDHDLYVQDIKEMDDGRVRVQSRCDKCTGRETKFYPAGTFTFVDVPFMGDTELNRK